MGVKYSLQCLDLQRKLQRLIEYLDYYATLSVQPIKIDKTELLWSARSFGKPTFDVSLGGHPLAWVTNFKYLGYHLTRKLGWGNMLQATKAKIAQRVAIVRACRINGSASRKMKRILFSSYVYPLFAWVFSIFPLLTDRQRDELSHYYFVCLKRCLGLSVWNDFYFSAAYNEKTLENLCHAYWNRYKVALARTTDGILLYERLVHE